MRLIRFTLVVAAFVLFAKPGAAQEKGAPGHFDFYLLDVAWGPDFCNVPGVVLPCKAPRTFVLHGLWPQNNDGTYPVNCGEAMPLPAPAEMLDVTPNLGLIQHEWDKHGTCTTLTSRRYFAAARKAYRGIHIPQQFAHPERDVSMTAQDILTAFTLANPQLPADGIVLGCSKGKFTAVAACFNKDMKPIACSHVQLCHEGKLMVPAAD